MAEVDDDLNATTDSIRADLEKLHDVEARKHGLKAADPEAAELSVEAEEIAGRILQEAVAERQLTDEASGGEEAAPA